MKKISLKYIFPIIKTTIQELNLDKEWADRDSITQELLRNKGIQNYLSTLDSDNKDLKWRVGNLLDWFSAHFTKESKFMDEYLNEFERTQIQVKSSTGQKRKIYAYKVLTTKIAEEIEATAITEFSEGSVSKILVNKYERNLNARKACISHHGLNCKVCGFNFRTFYGKIGENFIHVHHIIEISNIGKEYIEDPIKDLVPVCANCHSIIHKKEPALTVEELKREINNLA